MICFIPKSSSTEAPSHENKPLLLVSSGIENGNYDEFDKSNNFKRNITYYDEQMAHQE